MALVLLVVACAPGRLVRVRPGSIPFESGGERMRVLELSPGVTATIVAPARIDTTTPVDLVLYALPNGNSTAETMGRRAGDGIGWRYDIQHIGAQTRALRERGLPQAVVVYLEADSKSWPSWRAKLGYERANARIVTIVEQLRAAVGHADQSPVTLTGHSGGGSFMFGFIEGQAALPDWLERIAFLDANYNFAPAHGDKLVAWLRRSPRNQLVTLAYDDREITLDGKKVVSDSGGTWRASQRMIQHLSQSLTFAKDTLGAFVRYRAPQVELLLHPNPENRILHTAMIGDMNGYMHALLSGRPAYDRGDAVLRPARVYDRFVEGEVKLPSAMPPDIPARNAGALTGSAFIASVSSLPRDERETAIRRELFAGNIPTFLRALRTVEAHAVGPDSIRHTVAYEVMPDYLAIGSDDDFVRMPMNPYTAQAFCDAFGFVLPTRKMVNDIWAAAPVHVEPRPLTQDRDAPLTFLQHHRIIEEQLAGQARGAFVAGIKKDVVVSNRLQEKANRVAIFGWHYLNGEPIQPVYAGHVDWYVDYSHGIRPVRRWMRVDGVRRSFEAVLADSTRRYLLSDEGAMAVWRY
ncbi:MAG: hypothetical protein WC700_12940 [Gemmatimonadaceae bacterium]